MQCEKAVFCRLGHRFPLSLGCFNIRRRKWL
nr:MAG TPA: hypothetical protein [Caudoviricetes sp.]